MVFPEKTKLVASLSTAAELHAACRGPFHSFVMVIFCTAVPDPVITMAEFGAFPTMLPPVPVPLHVPDGM